MIYLGFVGSSKDKWARQPKYNIEVWEALVKTTTLGIINRYADVIDCHSIPTYDYSNITVVSGGCDGTDTWCEEVADCFGIKKIIFKPDIKQWEDSVIDLTKFRDDMSINEKVQIGFKTRNMRIAQKSMVLHCIVPESNDYCYHCNTNGHLANGGCWTKKYFVNNVNKNGYLVIVK